VGRGSIRRDDGIPRRIPACKAAVRAGNPRVNPDSPAEIRAVLEERGLSLKKRWGQNFLVNRGARQRLIAMLEIQAKETVWEIGPGLGSMTLPLTEQAARVLAFEVDRGLCRFLLETFGNVPSFKLVPGDFLESWRNAVSQHGPPDRLLGNLPYRTASLMIADLIEGGLRPQVCVVTVQRELAERMASGPGTKSYSSFSVLCQSCFRVTNRGDLQPGSFFPVPEVVSSIVEMRPKDDAPDSRTLLVLSALCRGLFSSRRKTIRNNLASGRLGPNVPAEAVKRALVGEGIDLGRRAEQLSPEIFLRLARALTGASAR
jgi:16S rRNA (adenine1518-N6/adenine1519-N6)-dimethyltransferase